MVKIDNLPDNGKKNSKPTFEQARDAWLDHWDADPGLLHSDKTVVTRLYRNFNREHYDKTGELLAWLGWQRLMNETALRKAALSQAIRRLEGVKAINRGTRSIRSHHQKAGWKRIPCHPTKVRTGEPCIPHQGSRARFTTKVHHQGSPPRFAGQNKTL